MTSIAAAVTLQRLERGGGAMSVDVLVMRRVMQWEEQRKAAKAAAGRLALQQPAVTISRSYGARGRAIAEIVAQKLGLNLYDKELVEQIAERANVRQQVVESLDDQLRDRISNWVGEQFDSGYFTYSDYLENLSRVLLTIAQQERAVLVGRGANFVLRSDHTLRVRAYAPLELRVARVAESRGASERQARAEVLRVDAGRAAFVRRHFDQDITQCDHYDLMLNTEALSEEICAHLIVEAFTKRFGA